MRHFDVTHHQPHPPGYPLFILAARTMSAVVRPEWVALGALSATGAALGLLAVFALARSLTDQRTAILAALLAATAPLYWFTAARPLSDSFGLAAAVAAQALMLRAAGGQMLVVAALLAGLAAGIRSQVLWLTVPLLLATHAPGATRDVRAPRVVQTAAAFLAGMAVWFIPLVVLSDGPSAYWHALFDQGAEDLSGIRMLWTSPTLRTLVEALYYALVAPWADWILAVPVLLLAAAGLLIAWRSNRRAVALLSIAFGPYFLFDVLFQETFTVRYALPLVVPITMLAAMAVAAMPQAAALPVTLAVAMYGAHAGGRSIAAYSRQPAPVFRMLTDMRAAASSMPGERILAPDRRASFDLRRPMAWLGAEATAFDRQLPAPPQHEWQEAVKYWNEGGRAPVWFVVDPHRAAIDLVQHGEPRPYRYSQPFPALMSGTRPADLDWYVVDSPDWYVGDGWSLTPEAAGVSQVDANDAPRMAWIRQDAVDMVLGGRNFGPPATLSGFVGNSSAPIERQIPSGPFLMVGRIPRGVAASNFPYLQVTLRVSGKVRDVALEQFDASGSRALLGYGTGWHEREFNPATGQMWRWLSDTGQLQYVTGGRLATLRIRGETPLRYYSKPSRVIVRAGGQILTDQTVSDDFTIDVAVPPAVDTATLVVETDQTHVPAERSWRGSADRRKLGLRVYSCSFLPATASAPGTAANFPPAR